MALPDLQGDLKPHLNKTTSVDDAELQEILDAAIEVVEGIVGPLVTAPVTEIHHGVSSGILVLRRTPATALVSMSVRTGPTSTLLTLSDYELDAGTGIVRVVAGSGFYGTYVVSYMAGFDTLPASVRLAVLIIAAHLWETQRGAAQSPLAQQQAEDVLPFAGPSFAIPNRAKELLAQYIEPAVA